MSVQLPNCFGIGLQAVLRTLTRSHVCLERSAALKMLLDGSENIAERDARFSEIVEQQKSRLKRPIYDVRGNQ